MKLFYARFSAVFAMQNIIFRKIPTLRIKYYSYFADRPNYSFFAVLPVDQKLILVSPYYHYLVSNDSLMDFLVY